MHKNIQKIGRFFASCEKGTPIRAIIAGMKGLQYAMADSVIVSLLKVVT